MILFKNGVEKERRGKKADRECAVGASAWGVCRGNHFGAVAKGKHLLFDCAFARVKGVRVRLQWRR